MTLGQLAVRSRADKMLRLPPASAYRSGSHLISDACQQPAVNMKGQFGPAGALFDGWETRRHNPDHDWCVCALPVQRPCGG